jgi:hypothetical protein
MAQTKAIVEIPGLLQNKISKTLTFEYTALTIYNTLSYLPATILPSDQIAAFRYGIKWIRGYQFTFGRQYIIELKTYDDKQHQIKLGVITASGGILILKYGPLFLSICGTITLVTCSTTIKNYCLPGKLLN